MGHSGSAFIEGFKMPTLNLAARPFSSEARGGSFSSSQYHRGPAGFSVVASRPAAQLWRSIVKTKSVKQVRAEAKRILRGFEQMTDAERVALAKRLNAHLQPTD